MQSNASSGGTLERRADIAVYAPDGSLQLIVEVKNRPDASTDWAARMFRNMTVHSAIPDAPFFMLALPDTFYLWENRPYAFSQRSRLAEDIIDPDYEIDAHQALAPYMDGAVVSLQNLSEQGLELLVASWLTNLLNSDLTENAVSGDLDWLFGSGLYNAIKRGSLATEAVL